MKVKRSGFVYSLYCKNLRNLWILAGILILIVGSMIFKSHNYLANYLFYRASPDEAALTEFLAGDQLDIDTVCADIAAHGGEMALNRTPTLMFFRDNVYQEGSRYRFTISLDPEKMTDTGIYYDDAYRAYTGITDPAQLKELIPRENYTTEHLWFYDWNGLRLVMPVSMELEEELGETLRVTFAPIGIYSLYMVQDLQTAGYSGSVCNFLMDARKTPVDFEDDDFKDLVMILPFMLLALIPAILFTVAPALHPTYRQLEKFARTIPKAVEQVDANYEEFGILEEGKKEWYLEDWIIRRSPFKTGIEKDFRKQAK